MNHIKSEQHAYMCATIERVLLESTLTGQKKTVLTHIHQKTFLLAKKRIFYKHIIHWIKKLWEHTDSVINALTMRFRKSTE